MWKHGVPSKPMTHVKARISHFIVDIRKDVSQGCDGESSEHALVLWSWEIRGYHSGV